MPMQTEIPLSALRQLWLLCLLSGLILFPAIPGASAATSGPGRISVCDQAAVKAAQLHDVPLDILRAISRVETGRASGARGVQPWPWTVNMEGKGHWFRTRDEALAYVFRHFKRGARSFDVGCFQINFKWHGQAFPSVEAMFDPYENAAYAARFLKSLHGEYGNWSEAAGAYHSRTPGYAKAYAARFDRMRSRLDQMDPDIRHAIAVSPGRSAGPRRGSSKQTARPLTTGGAVRLGSLVPLNSNPAGSRALIEFE